MLGDTIYKHQPVDTILQLIDTISNETSDRARGMYFGNNIFHAVVGPSFKFLSNAKSDHNTKCSSIVICDGPGRYELQISFQCQIEPQRRVQLNIHCNRSADLPGLSLCLECHFCRPVRLSIRPWMVLAPKENPLNDPDLLTKPTPEPKSLSLRST